MIALLNYAKEWKSIIITLGDYLGSYLRGPVQYGWFCCGGSHIWLWVCESIEMWLFYYLLPCLAKWRTTHSLGSLNSLFPISSMHFYLHPCSTECLLWSSNFALLRVFSVTVATMVRFVDIILILILKSGPELIYNCRLYDAWIMVVLFPL